MPTGDFELRARAETSDPEETSGSLFSAGLRGAVANLVLETTAEGIWLIDAHARTTFVNRRMASLLGYGEEEMIGRPIFDFLDESRWQLAAQNLQKRRLGFEDRQEVQLIRKDGSRVWTIGSSNPVFDRNGQYAGALALIGDLTHQKQQQEALQREIDNLRRRLSDGAPSGTTSKSVAPCANAADFREPFRTVVVTAVLGTVFATIAITTAGAVIASALSKSPGPSDEF